MNNSLIEEPGRVNCFPKGTQNKVKPALFELHRTDDPSGVSGKGHVLDGVVFPGGVTVIRWRSENASVAVFNTFEQFEQIHVSMHGKSKIVWIDGFDGVGFVVRYLNKVAGELNDTYSQGIKNKEGFLAAMKMLRSKSTELERMKNAGQIIARYEGTTGKSALLRVRGSSSEGT